MSLINTSTSALLAFRRALDTTGHNMANFKTKGYSRQSVHYATRGNTDYAAGKIGTGVKIADIRRDADALVNSRLLDSTGEMARLAQLSSSANRLDSLFSDKASNIAGMWSDFFDAASGLASDASSHPHRQQLLDSANALSTRFHQLDRELGQMEEDINARLRASTDEINRLSQDIAELNSEIGNNVTNASPDLLDRRDLLVSQLVEITGGTAITEIGGQLNVMTAGGHSLVSGPSAATVTTTIDPYQPNRLHLAVRSQGQDVAMSDKTFGGRIGGMFEFRRDILDPGRADLGRLAVGLADRFNAAHKQGMDLNGALGEDFFSYSMPQISEHSGNSGTATLSARYGDLGELTGRNVQLYFDGAVWGARDPDTGAGIALSGTGTPTNPLIVGGVEVVVQGAANVGDSFLLQPTAGVAGTLNVAITDPSKIAAASPINAAAGLNNTSNAKVSAVNVTDINDANLLTPANIVFTSPTSYTINGGAPITWAAGDPISANGWQISLDSVPAAGDSFSISPTGPDSSDNSNAQRLATLEADKIFSGGTLSLKDAIGLQTSRIGSAARDVESQANAQNVLYTQAQSARAAISGVDLDEETGNLLLLQQAFQSSAQLLSAANTLFQTILNVTRG